MFSQFSNFLKSDVFSIIGSITTILSLIYALLTFLLDPRRYYFVFGRNTAKEKYVVDITEENSNDNIHFFLERILLIKSSKKNGMGFIDFLVNDSITDLYIYRQSFVNSFSNILYAPGRMILKSEIGNSWSENAISNGQPILLHYSMSSLKKYSEYLLFVIKKLLKFSLKQDDIIDYKRENYLKLIPLKYRFKNRQRILLTTKFDYSDKYDGPRRTSRKMILMEDVGIVYAETQYQSGYKDKYKLIKNKNYKNNYKNTTNIFFPLITNNSWTYRIDYLKGSNTTNFLPDGDIYHFCL